MIIDREWKKEYKGNMTILWMRKLITSLFYFRGYRKLFPDTPWYMPRAQRFLEKKVTEFERVFEFGSGDSSLWFAERVKFYVAVEHDADWYKKTSHRLKEKNLSNIEIIFCPPEDIQKDFDWEKEWPFFRILKRAPDKPEYKIYISAIDKFPDNYFDCIVIDGRERLGCLMHSLPKLAEHGIIIFDDSARHYYQEAFELLNNWHYKKFRFGLGETTFFAWEKRTLK